jgi:predicted metal-dependent enzyme (double-stranded beta helix superfamily)
VTPNHYLKQTSYGGLRQPSGVAPASVTHSDDSPHNLPRSLKAMPHNHGTWAVVSVYQGQEDYVVYARAESALIPVTTNTIRVGDAVILAEDIIHDLSTSAAQPTCSIHVYGGDLFDARRRSMWAPSAFLETNFNEREFTRSWQGAKP